MEERDSVFVCVCVCVSVCVCLFVCVGVKENENWGIINHHSNSAIKWQKDKWLKTTNEEPSDLFICLFISFIY